MDSRSARELRDANNGVFDVTRCNHHEVGELVNHNEQIRVFTQNTFAARGNLGRALGDGSVVVIDVLEPERVQVVVAHVHLFDDPLQRLGRLFRVRDDGRDEVRDSLVRRELDALGVDKNHANFGRRCLHEQRGDHRVDERRLAGTGCTRHEKVGHFGKVCDDELTLDVFSNADRHRVPRGDGRGRTQHIAEGDDIAVGVGDLDTNRGLAGDWGEERDLVRRDRVFDVARQGGNPFDLDALREFDLVARDGGSASETGDRRIDTELREDVGDRSNGLVVDGRRALGWCALDEDCVFG
ncbi:unannotated protein [freshwater metagenome]|uniref:Unannotated protein n=1 Tax=freshwater metagenome TaxID=449393 RepID=A0A6J7DMJ9_9ZZZZ